MNKLKLIKIRISVTLLDNFGPKKVHRDHSEFSFDDPYFHKKSKFLSFRNHEFFLVLSHI